MERDSVATIRRAIIPIAAVPISRDFRQDLLDKSENPGSSNLQDFSFDVRCSAFDVERSFFGNPI